MTAPLSARDIVASALPELGSVPSVARDFVCNYCLGPVTDYKQCYGCSKLFGSAPSELRRRVIPMTAVVNPSPWYSRLVTYKNGNAANSTVIAALATLYLTEHEAQLEELLDGPLSRLVVVPSTRGRSFERHSLALAVKQSVRFRDRLANALSHVSGATIGRQEYKPSIFTPATALLRGQRVGLIEDLWVSGSKALSAAGAVLAGGAESVVVLPIAREVRLSFWGEEHPYISAMRTTYDIRAWPLEP